MTQPHFFGYGSLVNTQTHSYPDPLPSRVKGWRRMWRHTTMSEAAFLTVIPDTTCEIDGLIAHVPNDDWAALDLREVAYFRTPVQPDDLTHGSDRAMEVQIYQTRTDQDNPPAQRNPILLSYLDVVAQGYLQVFGKDGVARFFETTAGWDTPIVNDRAQPFYPRHQVLADAETQLVDDHLQRLSAHVQDLHETDMRGKGL